MKENVFARDGLALVSQIHYDRDLTAGIDQAVAAIGGFDKLIEPGDTILVKPNFNTADPPPASSDPQFVQAVIKLLYYYGARRVVLGESSMISRSTLETLREAGMLQATQEVGADTVIFDEWVSVETGGRHLTKVAVAKAALEADKIVYVPCLKTHRLADFTMSLKLAMGFVRPRDRVTMHLWRLREKLVDLNLTIAPDLIIMDARLCFISGGPAQGEVREPGLILASGDRIAIDVEGIRIIQSYPNNSLTRDPWEFTMIRQAVEQELGITAEADYQVVAGTAEPRVPA
jgi:uncharacterized protein (DUF362 family)